MTASPIARIATSPTDNTELMKGTSHSLAVQSHILINVCPNGMAYICWIDNSLTDDTKLMKGTSPIA